MTRHWRWLPGALVVLLAGACDTTPDAPGESALTLERMQQAAVDFTRARDAGDALAMARAAGALAIASSTATCTLRQGP